MIFPKKCLGCPPFLGYICWPKAIGALLLLSAPLALLSFRRPWAYSRNLRKVVIDLQKRSVTFTHRKAVWDMSNPIMLSEQAHA